MIGTRVSVVLLVENRTVTSMETVGTNVGWSLEEHGRWPFWMAVKKSNQVEVTQPGLEFFSGKEQLNQEGHELRQVIVAPTFFESDFK